MAASEGIIPNVEDFPTTESSVELPSETAFIYYLEDAIRLPDGGWMAELWLADRARRENEGAWIYYRAPGEKVFKSISRRPASRTHGFFAEGQGGALHFVTFDKRTIFFRRVREAGTMNQPKK